MLADNEDNHFLLTDKVVLNSKNRAELKKLLDESGITRINEELKALKEELKTAAKDRKTEINKYNLSSGDYARRIQEKLATPSWLSEFDKFFINEIYHLSKLRTKALNINFEVDHVVPIMSKIVCGLHHPLNLEIVPAKLNRIKNNLFWPDMPLINEES